MATRSRIRKPLECYPRPCLRSTPHNQRLFHRPFRYLLLLRRYACRLRSLQCKTGSGCDETDLNQAHILGQVSRHLSVLFCIVFAQPLPLLSNTLCSLYAVSLSACSIQRWNLDSPKLCEVMDAAGSRQIAQHKHEHYRSICSGHTLIHHPVLALEQNLKVSIVPTSNKMSYHQGRGARGYTKSTIETDPAEWYSWI